jgi:hypothetical protein
MRMEEVGISLGEKPRFLGAISLVALFLASLYFYNVLTKVPQEVFQIEGSGSFLGFLIWVLLMFYLYVKQLVTTFRLSSGNRKAWKDMMRLCLLYMALALFSIWLGGEAIRLAFTFETNAFLVLLVMALLGVYLCLPKVRLFFTPGYAEAEGLVSWLLFVAGRDPFKSEKLLLI